MNLTPEQKSYHLRKIRTRMHMLDVNGDGYLGRDDYEMMADKLVEKSNLTKEQEESTRAAILSLADQIGFKSDLRRVTVEESAKLHSESLLSMSSEEKIKVVDTGVHGFFDAIDTNNDGHISMEEYKVFFSVLCPLLGEKDVKRSFNAIDSNKDGVISREEFWEAAKDFFQGVEPTEISETFCGPLLQLPQS